MNVLRFIVLVISNSILALTVEEPYIAFSLLPEPVSNDLASFPILTYSIAALCLLSTLNINLRLAQSWTLRLGVQRDHIIIFTIGHTRIYAILRKGEVLQDAKAETRK